MSTDILIIYIAFPQKMIRNGRQNKKGWPETTKSVKTSQKMYIVAELLTMGRKSVLICLEFSNA